MSALLKVENLSVTVQNRPILYDVSLEMEKGETWGLVGASGAGKSMLARSITGLLPRGISVTGGQILYNGLDWLKTKELVRRRIRGNGIGYLVQNTASGLDPVYTVQQQMVETLLANDCADSQEEAIEVSADWLGKVGFIEVRRILSSYPHSLSGGMVQRVYLAMVFMLNPELVIADEFSTGLDSTTEKEMLGLLFQVAEKSSLLMITHNILLLGGLTDKMAVMNGGVIVESGPTELILKKPLHAYSQALLGAGDNMDPIAVQEFGVSVVSCGCPFFSRCDSPWEECAAQLPHVREVEGRKVRCHRY
ncbi:MAG: ABC transporter ATP-binding protein [Acidobacteria bacterium]|nr:ABC transporter ATP-binding protein [Acidobacteriota bacterium]